MAHETVISLPHLPGVYVFKDAVGTILYIGKAKDLKRRVSSYFQKMKEDAKIARLIEAHETIGFIVTRNALEALLLEAHLIQLYQPEFNVLLKTGNPFLYLHFTDSKNDLPKLEMTRTRTKRDGRYFGPFLNKKEARQVYDFLLRTFRLFICGKTMEHGCLDYHIGRCAGSCRPDFDKEGYLTRLELAYDVLAGKHQDFMARLKEQIALYNERLEFEQARALFESSEYFEHVFEVLKTKFSFTKYRPEIESVLDGMIEPGGVEKIEVMEGMEGMEVMEVDAQKVKIKAYEQAAYDLQIMLDLEAPPVTIDCFDISHFQGRGLVGSCVRFTRGMPDKKNFRHFIIKTVVGQDDYASLREIVSRRYRDEQDKPDLIVIDGGKGQLAAVLPLVGFTPCVSLAKREERLFSEQHPEGVVLEKGSDLGRLLMSLRDYAHHFAVSFHRLRGGSRLF